MNTVAQQVQQWEYLEIYVLPSGFWTDSTGHSGAPMRMNNGWVTAAGALNELGSQGWELTGAIPAEGAYRLFLKRLIG